jgi:hypothetical protein
MKNIDNLDGLFEELATKLDMKSGEDIILKEQMKEFEKKQ